MGSIRSGVRATRVAACLACLVLGVFAAGCGSNDSGKKGGGPSAGSQKGQVNMTVDEFRKAVFNKDNYGQWEPKKTFFDKFGEPARISDVGDDTFLYYDCKDGKVRVKCFKTSFQRDDTINATAVDRE